MMAADTHTFFGGSQIAELYSKFRPVTPDVVVTKIVSFLKEKYSSPLQHAVDAGCGSGQSTKALAPHFQKVTGIDVSEAQIKEAKSNNTLPNVEYKACPVEKLQLENGSVQLVTAGQSAHWFDLPEFYKAVDRLLVPSGVVALYGYDQPVPVDSDQSVIEDARKAVREYYEVMMEKLPLQRDLVDSHYKDLELPYQDSIRVTLTSETPSSLSAYCSYFTTWSPYHQMKAEDPERAEFVLNRFRDRVKEALHATSMEMPITLSTEYFILMGRKN